MVGWATLFCPPFSINTFVQRGHEKQCPPYLALPSLSLRPLYIGNDDIAQFADASGVGMRYDALNWNVL